MLASNINRCNEPDFPPPAQRQNIFVAFAKHIHTGKRMFVDLFIHGAMVSRVSAVGQAEWEARGDWGFSTPSPGFCES